MDIFGYASVNNVQRILAVLESKGYIRRNYRGGARCIEIVKNNDSVTPPVKMIPVLGQIAAGVPIYAEQNVDGYISLDLQLIGSYGDFALRVKGDSMKNANILDNDLIIVRQMNNPQNNDIVVALLDEEATVKRYVKDESYIRLLPENPDYQPITINKNDMYFRVLGKVEAVIHSI